MFMCRLSEESWIFISYNVSIMHIVQDLYHLMLVTDQDRYQDLRGKHLLS
jgi:hypothetical protein